MLGNPNWFKRRKYTGWGLTPATWQGWIYVGVLFCCILVTAVLMDVLQLPKTYQTGIFSCLLALIAIDTADIAMRMKKDEREASHEAFSERNAAWVMVMILGCGLVFQITVSILQGSSTIDPFIVMALLGGTLVKGVSNWYYLDK